MKDYYLRFEELEMVNVWIECPSCDTNPTYDDGTEFSNYLGLYNIVCDANDRTLSGI